MGSNSPRTSEPAVGDKLNIQAASGANRILTIAGLVDLGNKGVDQRVSFVALRTAQSLLGMIGGVTTIDLTVSDIYAAEKIGQAHAGGHCC